MKTAPAPSVGGPALDRVLAKFPDAKKVGNEWKARCPVHADTSPSLDIRMGEKAVLVKCRSNDCTPKDIVAAVGLTMSDLFDAEPTHKSTRPTTVPYEYRAATGERTFRVIRRDDPRSTEKTFIQERFENGKWIGGKGCMRDVIRVPFRFPELLAAPSEIVWVPEGEKCALAIASLGLVATSNSGGAGKWLPSHSAGLKGRHVVILPDNDSAGEDHAALVAKALDGVAASVKLLRLPDLPAKGDVVDWLAAGGTADELRRLADAAPVLGSAVVSELSRPMNGQGKPSTSPAEATVICFVDIDPKDVDYLWPIRIPRRMLTIFDGDSNTGKTTTVLDLVACVSTGRPWPGAAGGRKPGNVLFLGHEDSPNHTIRPRLDAARADPSRVYLLTDVGGRFPKFPDDAAAIEAMINKIGGVDMFVLDPITAYLGGVDLNRDNEIRTAVLPLTGLADRTGAAVLMIRHLRKSGNVKAIHRGLGSVGISSAARASMMLLEDPDDPEKDPNKKARILAWPKLNVGPAPKSLRWRFGPTSGGRPPSIVWDSVACDLTADEILERQDDKARPSGRLSEATDFIRETLKGGPMPSMELERRARDAGFPSATYDRARRSLSIQAVRRGTTWQSQLPGVPRTSISQTEILDVVDRDDVLGPPQEHQQHQGHQQNHGGEDDVLRRDDRS
jgi:putative DNA primase/helicase